MEKKIIMEKKIRVYIASPYTLGDREENVQLQIDAYYYLLKLGFNPYMPVYPHFIVKKYPDVDTYPWLEIDKSWLEVCDIMVRLHPKDKNGVEIKSLGADEEEAFARNNRIPVFHFDIIEEMLQMIEQITI